MEREKEPKRANGGSVGRTRPPGHGGKLARHRPPRSFPRLTRCRRPGEVGGCVDLKKSSCNVGEFPKRMSTL